MTTLLNVDSARGKLKESTVEISNLHSTPNWTSIPHSHLIKK